MKNSIIAIALPLCIAIGSAVNAQTPEQTAFESSEPRENAGLSLKTDTITSSFQWYLSRFGGYCPTQWSGSAASDDIRFISLSTPPAKNLKVQLISLTTGESLEKGYEQEGKGSSDFSLRKLGETDGTHEIEYLIFDKDTEVVLEEGSFAYTVITAQTDFAQWPGSDYCHDVARSYTHFGTLGYGGLYDWPYFGGHYDKRLKHKHYLKRKHYLKHYLKHKHVLKDKHLTEKEQSESHVKQHKHQPIQAKQREDAHKTPQSTIKSQKKQSPRPQQKAVKTQPSITERQRSSPTQPPSPPQQTKKRIETRKTAAPPKAGQQNTLSPRRTKSQPSRKTAPVKGRKVVKTSPRKAIKTRTVEKKRTPLRRANRLQQKRRLKSQPSRTSIRSRQHRQQRAIRRASPRRIQRQSSRRRAQSTRRAVRQAKEEMKRR